MADPDRNPHVFVSYAGADGPATDPIARAMREAGLHVFRDRDSLVPGQFWSERLEQALGNAQAIVVCLGPSGIGRWQKREIALALERQVRDETFPVIPLLLPGADDIGLSFLRLSTWIDLRKGADAPRALGTLFRAVRGESPLAEAEHPDLRAGICPYRGLEAFREELGGAKSYFPGPMAFSPDGSRLAAGDDKVVRVWDAQSGKEVLTLRGHEGRVGSVAFSPDGRHILTTGDTEALVWDAKSGARVASLLGHTEGEGVRSAAFSPDRRFIVTAGKDHTRAALGIHARRACAAVTRRGEPTTFPVQSRWFPDRREGRLCRSRLASRAGHARASA